MQEKKKRLKKSYTRENPHAALNRDSSRNIHRKKKHVVGPNPPQDDAERRGNAKKHRHSDISQINQADLETAYPTPVIKSF
jgi:hypothetical protein